MKKQWIPVLIAAVLTLSACGGAAPVAPDSAPSAFTPAAPEMPSAPSEGLTEADARRIALEHAGLSENDVSSMAFFKTEKDDDDGRAEYEIEFSDGATKYDYTIDAETGAILSFEANDTTENVTFSFDAGDAPPSGNGSDAPSAIGPEEAKAIALAHAGVSESDAARLEAKRDRDDGRDEYDVEFYVGRTEYSYEIDAASGEILSFEADND